MEWPLLIKQLREAMLLTQNELASILGVSFVSVNRWENSVNQPTMKMKRRLLKMMKKYGFMEK